MSKPQTEEKKAKKKVVEKKGAKKKKRILLFDVDGTLTKPRNKVTDEMNEFISQTQKNSAIAIVGGSDLHKICEQLGEEILHNWDYVFAENGLMAYQRGGSLLAKTSINDHLSPTQLEEFKAFVLDYVSKIKLPVKRTKHLEIRTGMINVSPIGRDCTQEERDQFEAHDKVHKVREKMIKVLQERFKHLNFVFSIGGQISFDVFPSGWDKTYCLRYLEKQFDDIHFFGDKTDFGGNDHQIFISERTIGHSVVDPDDTVKQVTKALKEEKRCRALKRRTVARLKFHGIKKTKILSLILKYANYFHTHSSKE